MKPLKKMLNLWIVLWITTTTWTEKCVGMHQHFEIFNNEPAAIEFLKGKEGARIFLAHEAVSLKLEFPNPCHSGTIKAKDDGRVIVEICGKGYFTHNWDCYHWHNPHMDCFSEENQKTDFKEHCRWRKCSQCGKWQKQKEDGTFEDCD